MTEFIVRLTDEQEQLLREANEQDLQVAPAAYLGIKCDLFRQAREAIKLYDELVAEAKAKSDD